MLSRKRAVPQIRGAHASRMLVSASRRNELCKTWSRVGDGLGSSTRRDAGTNTRDGCAPRNKTPAAYFFATGTTTTGHDAPFITPCVTLPTSSS